MIKVPEVALSTILMTCKSKTIEINSFTKLKNNTSVSGSF